MTEKECLKIQPIFFILVKKTWIEIKGENVPRPGEQSVSYEEKHSPVQLPALSEDCECILIHYNHSLLQTMISR